MGLSVRALGVVVGLNGPDWCYWGLPSHPWAQELSLGQSVLPHNHQTFTATILSTDHLSSFHSVIFSRVNFLLLEDACMTPFLG